MRFDSISETSGHNVGTNTTYLIQRILMVCWLLAFFVLSAHPLPSSFRTIDITDGLSHNMINAIYKDGRGFIWLGTQLGLDRYDGINVVNYPRLNGYSVYTICEAGPLYLWIGTDKGLFKMNRHTEEVQPVTLESKQSSVRTFHVLSADTLLTGTLNGFFIVTGEKARKYTFDANPVSSTNSVNCIIPSGEDGGFWLTTLNGLVHLNIRSGDFVVYKNSDTDQSFNAFSRVVQVGDRLYIGTRTHGIVTFDIHTRQFADFPYTGNGYITTLSQADENSLFVGTNGGGLVQVNLHTGQIIEAIEHATDGKGISSNAVYSFLRDSDIFWIGTYMGGLNYNPTHGDLFSVYSFGDKLNTGSYNIRSFYIGDDGEKLIGTRDGFFYVSATRNIVKRFTTKTSILQSDIILSVLRLGDDYLIGTYGGGIYRFNPATLSLSWFIDAQNFKHGSFSGYVTDDKGMLWFATSHGVYTYNLETQDYSLFDSSNSGLANNSVFCITKDSRGQIWLGTTGAVYMYDPQTGVFRSGIFPSHVLPFIKSVRYIYEDRQGNLWFCDDKEGVVKVDGNFSSFTHYTTDDFLPSNSVTSIIEDENGGLWFASQRGLVFMDPQNGHTNFYSLFDGIPGYIFNPSVQRTDDGTLWWGNEQGLVFFNPHQSIRKEKQTYRPAITSIAVAGRTLNAGDEGMPLSSSYMQRIEIMAGNSIGFTFSALNYSVQNTDIYEYMLEGHDKGWHVLMSGNTAFYKNLAPGRYTFYLKSSSAPDLVTSLQLKVKRNIPSTVWVVLIVFTSCLVLIFSYSRLLTKYRRMKESQQAKEHEQQRQKYARSKVEQSEASMISRRLVAYMEEQKPYLKPDLKLQDVANAVGCSSVELSQVLNIHLNTNYTDFINQYRVEEFIRRVQLKSASRYTLTTLSEQSGFSSRTSFFRSFKKLKGKTPAEYIRDIGIVTCTE